jgi:hypothetical protein
MNFIYLQQSGKPVDGTSGNFWCLAGLAIPGTKWRTLQARVSGLQRSFQQRNYRPGITRLNANDMLHPRNATRSWHLAYCKGLERIVASLGVKIFLVVVDKRTTDKPAHPKWLLPLSYQYLMRPIVQYLRESSSLGMLVIPEGRPEEREVIGEIQYAHTVTTLAKTSPIVASPVVQNEAESAGLQVADFICTTARRYHELVYPKLYAKQTLEGYDAIINSHYQGFVKPNTFQSLSQDSRGYRIRGYIYLWRRETGQGGGGDDSGSSGADSGGSSQAGHSTGRRYGPGMGNQAQYESDQYSPPQGQSDSDQAAGYAQQPPSSSASGFPRPPRG